MPLKIKFEPHDAKIARADLLGMIYHARSGHPGGSLSCVDLIGLIYEHILICSQNISRLNGDFILSKGHACPALYAVAGWAKLISKSTFESFRKINGALQGHPNILTTPWVGASTGSLGQGFSVAIGMALSYKYKQQNRNVFVLLGDGELQEGEVWEGAMFASHNKLNNLCVIVDYNKLQSDNLNSNIVGLEPLAEKWRSFGWDVLEIDGHDCQQIRKSLEAFDLNHDSPTVIIANTMKGRGVSFMENMPAWHGSVTMKQNEFEIALRDLGFKDSEIGDYISGKAWN